ncbi:hypothetical protein M405DRAFT_621735 [Rhizopogon salebrosus TDB-379]|nr:hypothetical protein M405DRAFT_621735 [Rhizopogon salebrosus TDB-379]
MTSRTGAVTAVEVSCSGPTTSSCHCLTMSIVPQLIVVMNCTCQLSPHDGIIICPTACNIDSWRSKQKQVPRPARSSYQLATVRAMAYLPFPAMPDNHKMPGTSSLVLLIQDLISTRMSSRAPRRQSFDVFSPAPATYSMPLKFISSARSHR